MLSPSTLAAMDAAASASALSANCKHFEADLRTLRRQAAKQGRPRPRVRSFAGLSVTVENPKGSVRSGTDKGGKKWSVRMQYPYGFIRRGSGADGDSLDVYLGPDEKAENAYIVNQDQPSTHTFDEQKAMLGFDSAEQAKAAYLAHYDRPDFFRSMVVMPMSRFRQMLTTAEPGGIRWKRKHRRDHEAAAMFTASSRKHFSGDGNWITVGGHPAQRGSKTVQHAGGTPVHVSGSGQIDKGPPALKGKAIDKLKRQPLYDQRTGRPHPTGETRPPERIGKPGAMDLTPQSKAPESDIARAHEFYGQVPPGYEKDKTINPADLPENQASQTVAPSIEEPWTMTADQYVNARKARAQQFGEPVQAGVWGMEHEQAVAQALNRGEQVPEETLQEYPSLMGEALVEQHRRDAEAKRQADEQAAKEKEAEQEQQQQAMLNPEQPSGQAVSQPSNQPSEIAGEESPGIKPEQREDEYGKYLVYGDAIDTSANWKRFDQLPPETPVAFYHATNRKAAEAILQHGYKGVKSAFTDTPPDYTYMGGASGLGTYLGLQGRGDPVMVVFRTKKGDVEPDAGSDWKSQMRVPGNRSQVAAWHGKDAVKNPTATATLAQLNQVRAHQSTVEPIGILDPNGAPLTTDPRTWQFVPKEELIRRTSNQEQAKQTSSSDKIPAQQKQATTEPSPAEPAPEQQGAAAQQPAEPTQAQPEPTPQTPPQAPQQPAQQPQPKAAFDAQAFHERVKQLRAEGKSQTSAVVQARREWDVQNGKQATPAAPQATPAQPKPQTRQLAPELQKAAEEEQQRAKALREKGTAQQPESPQVPVNQGEAKEAPQQPASAKPVENQQEGRESDKLPQDVRREVERRLQSVRSLQQKLAESRDQLKIVAGEGKGGYSPEGPEQQAIAQQLEQAKGQLEEFRGLATKKGINADRVIEEMGGAEPGAERHDAIHRELKNIQQQLKKTEDYGAQRALRDRQLELEEELAYHKPAALARAQAEIDREKAQRAKPQEAPHAAPAAPNAVPSPAQPPANPPIKQPQPQRSAKATATPAPAGEKSHPDTRNRSAIERTLLDHLSQTGGGYTREDEKALDEAAGAGDPFLFHGKLPTEIKEFMQGRPELRRLFRVTNEPGKAGGADAVGALGDRYLDIAERKAGGGIRQALEAAKNSPDPQMRMLAALHETMPAKSDRKNTEPTPAADLQAGEKMKIHGIDAEVSENEEGERVLKDHGDLPDVPVDALDGLKLPVDKGSREMTEPGALDDPFGDIEDDQSDLVERELEDQKAEKSSQAPKTTPVPAGSAGVATPPAVAEDKGNQPTAQPQPTSSAPAPAPPAQPAPDVDTSRQLGLYARDKSGNPVEVGEHAGQANLFNPSKFKLAEQEKAKEPEFKNFDPAATPSMFPGGPSGAEPAQPAAQQQVPKTPEPPKPQVTPQPAPLHPSMAEAPFVQKSPVQTQHRNQIFNRNAAQDRPTQPPTLSPARPETPKEKAETQRRTERAMEEYEQSQANRAAAQRGNVMQKVVGGGRVPAQAMAQNPDIAKATELNAPPLSPEQSIANAETNYRQQAARMSKPKLKELLHNYTDPAAGWTGEKEMRQAATRAITDELRNRGTEVRGEPANVGQPSSLQKQKVSVGGHTVDAAFRTDGQEHIEDQGGTKVVTYTKNGVRQGYFVLPEGTAGSRIHEFVLRKPNEMPPAAPAAKPSQFEPDVGRKLKSRTAQLIKQSDLAGKSISFRQALAIAKREIGLPETYSDGWIVMEENSRLLQRTMKLMELVA